MQPTSLNFAAFLIISLVIYYIIPKRIQNNWLTLINLFYVSSFGLLGVIYLFVVSLVVYILGLRLSKTKRKKQNSELLIAIVALAAGLVIFKYYKLIFPPNIILGPEIMATSHDLILSLFNLYNGVVMV